jgi:class 3 adenylate cyclase
MTKHHPGYGGIDLFLKRFCADPTRLKAALLAEPRLEDCADDQPLCRTGDLADCFWIVERGEFCIRSIHAITKRGPGEIIGEAAFFRTSGPNAARRGADVIARGRSSAWRIDRTVLDSLPLEEKVLWMEAICQALVVKLDEATDQRSSLTDDLDQHDVMVRRFVCPEGVQAVRAAMRTGTSQIAPVRKRALIWFSDIAGFSTYSEKLTPTEVADLLKLVTNPQGQQIEAAGGQIDKHMGDGVMAFWLCPDDARLAQAIQAGTRAALAAAEHVQAVVASRGLPLGIRIGLHVGDVAVGDFGSSDRIAFTIVGEPVNTASRYEQYKPGVGEPDGALRISADVYARLDETIRASFRPDPILIPAKHDRRYAAHLSIF